MTALPSSCHRGHHTAAEEHGDPATTGKVIWRKNCGQQASDTVGGRWRW